MKTIITATLTAVLLIQPVLGTTHYEFPNVPETTNTIKETHWALAALVLTIAVIAGVAVIKLHSREKELKGPVALVLQCSQDNANWINRATNVVDKVPPQPKEIFREVIGNDTALYRVQVFPVAITNGF